MFSPFLLAASLIAVFSTPLSPRRPAYPWEDPSNIISQPGHSAPSNTSLVTSDSISWYPGKPYSAIAGKPFCPSTDSVFTVPPLRNDRRPWTITILHTNDIHSHMDQFNVQGTDCSPSDISNNTCYGGIARFRTLISSLRKQYPQSYLLDAGDQFQGTLFYNYYKGNASVVAMNLLGYDAMAVGNHDFDDGPLHLARFIRQLNFPVLASNMDIRVPELQNIIFPYTILTKYGSRLAVIGYITNTTGDITFSGPNITFSNPVPVVQRTVDYLRNHLGVKRIICLSHNGYLDDIYLARNTRGISLIVGGHSHTLLLKDQSIKDVKGPYPTPIRNLDGKLTHIVQAKAWGQYIGVINIQFTANSQVKSVNGNPILLDNSIQQDISINSLIQQWRQPFDSISRTTIGTATVTITNADCSRSFCPLGNLASDALLNIAPTSSYIPIAMINGGTMRAGISAGQITIGTIMNIFPFISFTVTTTVNGKFILRTLDNLVTQLNNNTGKRVTSFAHFAGLHWTMKRNGLDLSDRVRDVQVRNPHNKNLLEPLRANTTYQFITINYVSNGGDSILPELLPNLPEGILISDMVINYVKQLGTLGNYMEQRVKSIS